MHVCFSSAHALPDCPIYTFLIWDSINKPHCCPALALSARAVHGTQGQNVLSSKEPVWEQIRYFVCVWKVGNFHSWTSSPLPVALSQKLPVTVQLLRIVFQLGSLFQAGSYYLFVFTEAMPYLPATWSLMCYPKLIFSFNFRNINCVICLEGPASIHSSYCLLKFALWHLIFPIKNRLSPSQSFGVLI